MPFSLSRDRLLPLLWSVTSEAPKLCFTLGSLPALAPFLYTKLRVCFVARSFTFLSFDFDLDLFPQSMPRQWFVSIYGPFTKDLIPNNNTIKIQGPQSKPIRTPEEGSEGVTPVCVCVYGIISVELPFPSCGAVQMGREVVACSCNFLLPLTWLLRSM